MKHLNLLTLAVIVVGIACAPPAAQESPELAAKSVAWEEAMNSADVEAVVALYSEDARLMPPNAETGQGHDAVRAAFGEMIDAGLSIELKTTEAMAAGNLGTRIGSYVLTSADGNEVDRGKYIETWEEVGGEWVITNDIWNSDVAVGAGTTSLLGTHMVEDGDRWLAAWSGENSRHADFAQNGAPNVRVFQSPDNPNLTGVLIDVADMDKFQAWLGGEEGAAAKAEDGVKDETLQILAEVK
jgi:ketosteroid isomerase-like protein